MRIVFVAMVHTGRRLISVKSRTVFPALCSTSILAVGPTGILPVDCSHSRALRRGAATSTRGRVRSAEKLRAVGNHPSSETTSVTRCFRRSPAPHRQRGENNSHHPDEGGRALLL